MSNEHGNTPQTSNGDRDVEQNSSQDENPTPPRNNTRMVLSLPNRTVGGPRLLCENFRSVFDEIRPFVEQARTANNLSLTNILTRQTSSSNEESAPPRQRASIDSVSLNIEEEPTVQNSQIPSVHRSSSESALQNFREPSVTREDTSGLNDDPQASATQAEEIRALLEVTQKYFSFVFILLVKCFYDNRFNILNFVILLVTFTHSNSVVKREAVKTVRRNVVSLLLELLLVVGCIVFMNYIYLDYKLFLTLTFVETFDKALSVLELLRIVFVMDVLLKLVTIIFKILIILMPAAIIPYHCRGKTFLFIEAVSQTIRSLAPIHPWLSYLSNSYEGPERIVSVVLAALYILLKGTDLMSKFRLLKFAITKVTQNVSIGTSPTKEQLQTAGNNCPICHDEYNSPILLQCKHIFCEGCVSTWFDREQTCPLCRAKIVDDPSWRDGATTFFPQMY